MQSIGELSPNRVSLDFLDPFVGVPGDCSIGFDFLDSLSPEKGAAKESVRQLGQEIAICLEKEKTDEFVSALSKKQFSRIIENSELFWHAFCYAFSQSRSRSLPFHVFLEENGWKITGGELLLSCLQEAIEDMRETFAEALKLRVHFTLAMLGNKKERFVQTESGAMGKKCRLLPPLSGVEKSCRNIAMSSLSCLAELVGAVSPYPHLYFETSKHVDSIESQEFYACEVYWVDPIHQILPLEILPRISTESLLHPLFESQTFCDWTLSSCEGEVLIDSAILFVRGGPSIQELMKSCKEGQDKILFLGSVSLSTIKAFAEYLYVGDLSFQVICQNEVPLDELLHIAYQCNHSELIDSCTNLIAAHASYKEIEQVRSLADLYKNHHLQQLYRFLLQRHEAIEITVYPFQDGSIDFSSIQEMLDQQRFSLIIQNKEFFWLVFCKEFSGMQQFREEDPFHVSFHQNKLSIRGIESKIEILKELLEEFRELLANVYDEDKKRLILCFLPMAGGLCTFREKNEHIDLSSVCKDFQSFLVNPCSLCRRFILPVLSALCASLGAECRIEKDIQKVIYSAVRGASLQIVDEIVIDWVVRKQRCSLDLKMLASRGPFGELLYPLYETGLLSDFTLAIEPKGPNEPEISRRVHSSILLAHGGSIRKMMVELFRHKHLEKRLQFKDLSQETLHAFIEYLYLGPDAPFFEKISKAALDELFCIAKEHQMALLADCCVNFISKSAGFEDVSRLQKLIRRHNDLHLDRLQKYLSLATFYSKFPGAPDLPDHGEPVSQLLEDSPDNIEPTSPYDLFLNKV